MSALKVHEDAEVAHLRAAARDMLVDALRECGYIDAQSVHLAMKRRHAEGTVALVVPARTVGRYMKDGPPTTPQGGTYEAFVALGQLADVQDELLEACHRLWARTRTNAARAPREQESWYQIIPVQDGRTYASIDVVTFSRVADDEIRGAIERISPPHERSYHWTIAGNTSPGPAAIFAHFFPWEPDNAMSRGCLMLQSKGYRPLRYEGLYWRVSDDGAQRVERELQWRRDVPQTALHEVALLDLDNTLRVGWSLRPWLAYLARNNVERADGCLKAIDALFEEYVASPNGDHDLLAMSCAQAYAEMARGLSAMELDEWARTFVANYDAANVHDFAVALVEYLKARQVAPIIVSGAPIELVKHHAARLGVEQYFGLQLHQDGHGRFTGEVLNNTGVAAEKRNVARVIRSSGRVAVLAAGDSESDLPLWESAPNKIVVGPREPQPDWPGDRTLRVDPGDSQWERIRQWLDANVEAVGVRDLPH
jgi:phosphoserine phosphatase